MHRRYVTFSASRRDENTSHLLKLKKNTRHKCIRLLTMWKKRSIILHGAYNSGNSKLATSLPKNQIEIQLQGWGEELKLHPNLSPSPSRCRSVTFPCQIKDLDEVSGKMQCSRSGNLKSWIPELVSCWGEREGKQGEPHTKLLILLAWRTPFDGERLKYLLRDAFYGFVCHFGVYIYLPISPSLFVSVLLFQNISLRFCFSNMIQNQQTHFFPPHFLCFLLHFSNFELLKW